MNQSSSTIISLGTAYTGLILPFEKLRSLIRLADPQMSAVHGVIENCIVKLNGNVALVYIEFRIYKIYYNCPHCSF